MQTANIMLELGGDSGTTVPKLGVTPSEIAVLRAIHGNDSVRDVEPAADVKISDRDEIRRLLETYGRIGPDGKDASVVSTLFPGVAARAYQSLDELDIPEDFYKAESRVKPKPAEKPVKAKKGAEPEPSPEDVEAALAAEDKLFD